MRGRWGEILDGLCDGCRLGFDALTITLPGADVHGENTTNSFFISLFFHTAVTIANQGAVLVLDDPIYRQICSILVPILNISICL